MESEFIPNDLLRSVHAYHPSNYVVHSVHTNEVASLKVSNRIYWVDLMDFKNEIE